MLCQEFASHPALALPVHVDLDLIMCVYDLTIVWIAQTGSVDPATSHVVLLHFCQDRADQERCLAAADVAFCAHSNELLLFVHKSKGRHLTYRICVQSPKAPEGAGKELSSRFATTSNGKTPA